MGIWDQFLSVHSGFCALEQAAEMSFRWRVAGLGVRARVRSSDIWRELGTAASWHQQKPIEVIWASDQDAIRNLSLRSVPGTTIWAKPPPAPRGRSRTHWRDYISRLSGSGWKVLLVRRRPGTSLLSLLPLQHTKRYLFCKRGYANKVCYYY